MRARISIRINRLKKLPKISQERNDFMLKPKQKIVIDMLVLGDLTFEQIADNVKISRRTLYNWRMDEEFNAELNNKMRLKISGIAPKALRRMEQLMEDANSEMVSHLSAKDLLDRAGFGAENTVNINGGAPVQIINDIPRAEGSDSVGKTD